MHLYTHTHRREYKNHNKFVSHSPLNILIKTTKQTVIKIPSLIFSSPRADLSIVMIPT